MASVRLDENLAFSTATLKRPDGKSVFFTLSGTSWVSDEDVFSELVRTTDGSGKPSGWQLTTRDNSVEVYDLSGKLISITDVLGNTASLSYDANERLDRVDSNVGEYLQFVYDTSDRLASIADHTTRNWGYRYDTDGNLEYVDNPDGTTRQYHYEVINFSNTLVGITDERNIRYATFEYDAEGRATASYHGAQTAVVTDRIQGVTIDYNDVDDTRTVTNSNGDASTYSTSVQLGVALVTDISGPGCSTCGTGNTSYQYDAANNVLSSTENEITTKLGSYDSRGQFGCKAEGITVNDTSTGVCAFDPIASPDAQRTDYTYDSRFHNKRTTKTESSVFTP